MTRRERLERKLEKRGEWSEKARARSEARFGTAHRIADAIPFGQPILVGHHSERHARRDQARIHSNMDKGVAEAKLASHHASKADGIERMLDRSIFDDDPDAIEALEARIAEQETANTRAKAINKVWRKGGAAAVRAAGLMTEKEIAETLHRMALCSWIRLPYATDSASIRKDRERIKTIRARQARAECAEAAGGVLITGDAFINVTFSEKPPYAIIAALKAAGFAWGGGCWGGYRERLPECALELVVRMEAEALGLVVVEAEPDPLEGLREYPSPAFFVTCAINHMADAEISAWVNSGGRRPFFESFASLLDTSPIPLVEKRAAVEREIREWFDKRATVECTALFQEATQ